jgi:hypothetical protein
LEVWAAKFPDQPKFKYILSNRPGPGTAEPVIIRVGSGSVYTSLLCALETGPSFGPHFLQGQKKRPTFIEKAHWYRRFVGKIAAKIEAQIQKINNIYTFFTLSNKKLKTKKKKKKKRKKEAEKCHATKHRLAVSEPVQKEAQDQATESTHSGAGPSSSPRKQTASSLEAAAAPMPPVSDTRLVSASRNQLRRPPHPPLERQTKAVNFQVVGADQKLTPVGVVGFIFKKI